MKTEKRSDKIIAALLYLLPVVFLIISYVFMTMTAEDIYQSHKGANMLGAAIEAFKYDSRLSDMYAWAVIKIFDYQFCFGVDTLVRLFDVAMGTAMIYCMTAIVLTRRPRLALRDGVVFAVMFLLLFLNPRYESLYVAFSNIHNYLVIGLTTVAFLLPFMLWLSGAELPNGALMRILMLIAGFLFGFSCNITPAAFMVTLVLVCAFYVIKERRLPIGNVLKSWQFIGVLGVLAAMAVMYGFGKGVSAYTTTPGYSDMTDYIPLSALLNDPIGNIERVLYHLVENFRTVAPYCIALALALMFEVWRAKNGYGSGGVKAVGAGMTFVIMHTLAMTQILAGTVLRLILPAYLVTLACVGLGTAHILELIGPPRRFITVAGVAAALLMTGASMDMADYRSSYNSSIGEVLDEIKFSEEEILYYPRATFDVPKSDVFSFAQYPLVADWTLTEPIYGKYIVFTD